MTAFSAMRHLLFGLALALVSAAIVWVMTRVGMLDHPDHRKMHARPTPKGGGLGIVGAFMLGIFALYQYGEYARIADPYFRGVILASVMIAMVAFADDLLDWPFVVKLLAQIAASLLAVGSGIYLHTIRLPVLGEVALGVAGPVISVVWILLLTNALNFIDGVNGLAAGVTFLVCAFLGGIAAAQAGWFVYAACLFLASGVLGFLPFNFPRARIFMGDVGSQFCGFILSVLALVASQILRADLSFLLVPLLCSGVLFDVCFTLIRRILGGYPVAQAHQGHIYHVAQRAGMAPLRITLLHWGFVLLGGATDLLFLSAGSAWKPAIVLLPLLPQLAWLAAVRQMARRAGLTAWG